MREAKEAASWNLIFSTFKVPQAGSAIALAKRAACQEPLPDDAGPVPPAVYAGTDMLQMPAYPKLLIVTSGK